MKKIHIHSDSIKLYLENLESHFEKNGLQNEVDNADPVSYDENNDIEMQQQTITSQSTQLLSNSSKSSIANQKDESSLICLHEAPTESTIIPQPFNDNSTSVIKRSFKLEDYVLNALNRKQSTKIEIPDLLPMNAVFVTSEFRVLPYWFPLHDFTVACICLIVSVSIMTLNIVVYAMNQ